MFVAAPLSCVVISADPCFFRSHRLRPCTSQKWSKGKVKEKLANLVLFDKATYDKMIADVPKQKLITPSIISEKLKVNGSLARKAVKELLSKNLIRAPRHALTLMHVNVRAVRRALGAVGKACELKREPITRHAAERKHTSHALPCALCFLSW